MKWGLWGPEPTAKKEFSKMFLVQKVILWKPRGRTCGQEEPPWDPEERLVIYPGAGRGEVQGRFPVRLFPDTGGLAVARLSFFPPAKH